jgi:sporulation protein YlmC with PRC-barrel domain
MTAIELLLPSSTRSRSKGMAMTEKARNEPTQFIIGTAVAGDDGDLGELTRVVVNPIARGITHLVVEPKHHRGIGHLVPIELVEWARDDEIRLRCTSSGFSALDEAEETHFVPGATGAWSYQQSQMLTLPYYQLGTGGMDMAALGAGGGQHAVTSDVTPVGEIDVRRGEHVHATDGNIGRVQGLIVDPRDHSVTHVLLDEGHLWGKKRVAIPIAAVARVDDGVRLRISKQDVEDLPAVSVDGPS